MQSPRSSAFEAPLQRARARSNEQYQKRLNVVLEQQARLIGQSLHDEAGQLLTAAYIALAEASRDLPAPLGERLLIVKRHLDGVEEHLRHIAQELHPQMLEEHGLVAALEFLARGFAARHCIVTEVHAKIPRRLPAHLAIVLYRVVQEGLTNIRRHARATKASITVTLGTGAVRCAIRDDGVGFDAAVAGRHGGRELGLNGMRERLAIIGGQLRIRSTCGVGTELIATIPLDR
jgi:signal transduction histidine kinase